LAVDGYKQLGLHLFIFFHPLLIYMTSCCYYTGCCTNEASVLVRMRSRNAKPRYRMVCAYCWRWLEDKKLIETVELV